MKKQNLLVARLLGLLKALAVPVAVYVLFGLLSGGRMFNSRTLMTVLRQSIQPSIICYALLLGMSIGMMNFGAGAFVLCASIVGSGISNTLGLGLPGVIIFCMLIALALSALMGFLYNLLRVPCMVLSLGLMLVYEALPRLLFSGGAVIASKDAFLARQPWVYVVMVICLVFFYIVYNKTPFGHNIRAIGSNQSVALAAGLNLDKIKFKNFMVGGIFLGVAAVLYLSTQGKVQNVAALGSMTIMIDGFMGVFLGMLLARWTDASLAVYFGVFTMKVLSAGFVAVGLNATWEDVVTGAFMLVIMAVSANATVPERIKLNRKFAAEANAERMKSAT